MTTISQPLQSMQDARSGHRREARSRSAVIAAPRMLEFREMPLPEPEPGQVRIRMQGCGVCASNVPVWEGRPWFEYPWDAGGPGHEGWGVVDAVGPGAGDLKPGDRVAALSYHAFAEYDLAEASAVVKLPQELAGRPFPGEPLGCAVNVFRRSGIRAGDVVAVVGLGFLGSLVTQLAVNAGARVVAIARRRSALEQAARYGAEVVPSAGESRQVAADVEALTGGSGCDVVIEATGRQEPLSLAASLVRVRGRLVIAGYHQDGLREVDMQSWNWRGIDVINAHERDSAIYVEGIQLAIREVAAGRLDASPLYSHIFPFDKLATALDLTSERPDGFLKALVVMDELTQK